MKKNPLLGYLMKDKKEDVVHTSTYAEAQNRGKIGAASTEGFQARLVADKNRAYVQRYRDSKVGESRNTVKRVGDYDMEKDMEQRAAIREKFGGGRGESDGARGAGDGAGGVGSGAGGVSSAEARAERAQRFAGGVRTEGSAPARRNPGIMR